MKHAIEDIADAAPGVQDIDNRVRVRQRNRVEREPDAGVSRTNANYRVDRRNSQHQAPRAQRPRDASAVARRAPEQR